MNTSMKSILLNRLVRTLDRVFTISSPEECNEQLYDICRAYGLLLNSSGLTGQHIPEEICAKVRMCMHGFFIKACGLLHAHMTLTHL